MVSWVSSEPRPPGSSFAKPGLTCVGPAGRFPGEVITGSGRFPVFDARWSRHSARSARSPVPLQLRHFRREQLMNLNTVSLGNSFQRGEP
jgi:hypothetical protein